MTSERLGFVRRHGHETYEKKLVDILSSRIGRDAAENYRANCTRSLKGLDLQPGANNIHTLTLNINGDCNFTCVMCDVPGDSALGNSTLDFTVTSRILEKAADAGIKCCMMGSGSEITLSKDWQKVVEKASSLFPDTILFTNGSLLKESDLEFILASGLARLNISLDAFTATTFEKIRGYNLLDKIKSNILKLMKRKFELNQLSPLVRVSFVEQDCNVSEKEDFIAYWSDNCDGVEIQDCLDFSSISSIESGPPVKLDSSEFRNNKLACHYPGGYLSVWSDGNVSPCCTHYGKHSKEISLGNMSSLDLVEESFDEILEHSISLHKKFSESRCSQDIPVTCQVCISQKRESGI